MSYSDTFTAATPDPFWTWVAGENPGDAEQAGGVMRLKATDYHSWWIASPVDLRDSTVVVEIVTPPINDGTQTSIHLHQQGEAGPYFYITVFGGVTTINAAIPDWDSWGLEFDPGVHSFLRFTESDGTIALETSGDQDTWTPMVSGPTPGNFEVGEIEFRANSFIGGTTPSFVEWDNFSLTTITVQGVATRLINRPCTLVRKTASATSDDYGNAVDSEMSIDTFCEVQQQRRNEPGEEGEFSVGDWVGFFLPGIELDTGDAVVVDGLGTFELVGAPWPARNPRTGLESHVETSLRIAAGAED